MTRPMQPTASRSTLDVSVVLPVYNESGHVAEEIGRIRRAMDESGYTYEIIVVDDGSTDGTAERLRRTEGIRLILFAQNRGPGFARKVGTHAARGRVVVWTDVDMSYPNERIPQLVAELDGYDQVVGARTSEKGTRKLLRVPAKWLIRKLAEFLSGQRIPDLNSGMRAFRREVAAQFLHLLPTGFSHVTTMTLAFLGNDYSVKYVPIEYRKRAGTSKFHWFRDTYLYILQVTRMMVLWRPMKVFMPLALLLMSVGTGKVVYDLVSKDFRLASNTLGLLLSAVGVMTVGLLADLIVQLNKDHNVVDPAAIAEVVTTGETSESRETAL